MKTILIINDKSPNVINAAKLALAIAQKMQAKVLVANVFEFNKIPGKPILVGDEDNQEKECCIQDFYEHLEILNTGPNDFEPDVEQIDWSAMDENQIARIINEKNIWMVIKGISNDPSVFTENDLNFNTILNKVQCPLLLVPGNWHLKNIERMVYIADLRYCQLPIVKYLAALARPWHADLSVAHLSKNGLPDIDESYAQKVFNDEIASSVQYEQLFFNNVREKDLRKAVDVFVNGMHNSLLVMVKNRFHFNEIVGPYLNNILPSYITIPLLVFPC